MNFRFFIVLLLAIGVCSCIPYRSVVHNLPKIKTNQIFPHATVQPDTVIYEFAEQLDQEFGKRYRFANLMNQFQQINFDALLEKNNTRAFMVVRRDTIIFEQYFKGSDKDSYLTSFSTAKAIMSAMVGGALEEGKIQSLEDPVSHYLPEMDIMKYGEVTLEHLLQHTSGLRFKGIGHIYYGRDVFKNSLPIGFRQAPGTGFRYENANAQLLGIVLERVYGKPIHQLWEEKVWSRIGTEAPLYWAMDGKKHSQAKTFCCIDAKVRDFARLGRVWMNEGRYGDEQIFPVSWMKAIKTPVLEQGAAINYKYQFWQAPQEYACFLAAGMYGQMIFMCPEKNLMFVRFGERGNLQMDDKFWIPVFLQLMDQMALSGEL
jgi:CubicO group peptidase (beta-lactamase class C family)